MLNPRFAETDEEKRQYEVARQFVAAHPEYTATVEQSNRLLDWMEMRDMKMTLEGLEIAHKAVFCGEPEPKVMSPDLFFQKVKPTQNVPKSVHVPQDYLQLLDKGLFAGDDIVQKWKPMSTGIAGATTVNTSDLSYLQAVLLKNSWSLNMEEMIGEAASAWGPLDLPENKPEKPVASMPTEWYSGDVIEIQTTRRIKDVD